MVKLSIFLYEWVKLKKKIQKSSTSKVHYKLTESTVRIPPLI